MQAPTMASRPAEPKKYITPAPSSYEPEKSEKWLAEKATPSMGIKPKDPKKYLTPAPGAYEPEKSEKYLEEHIQHSIGIKPKEPKKYVTPSHATKIMYQVVLHLRKGNRPFSW